MTITRCEIFDDQGDNVSALVMKTYGLLDLICARAKTARTDQDPFLIEELTRYIDGTKDAVVRLYTKDPRIFCEHSECFIIRKNVKFESFFKENYKDDDISYRICDLSTLASERK
jgi:hypothetical protein